MTASDNPPNQPIRTLIVDDESLARSLVRSLLDRDSTLEVVGECNNGEAALAEIRAQNPDLVFLDVRMPLLDGVGVVKRLAADGGELPYIIFLTAFDDYAIEAFEYNALDYLVKPIQKVRFQQSLERARQAIRQRKLCQLTERIVAMSADGSIDQPVEASSTKASDDHSNNLVVWKGTEAINIHFDDIVWVEAANQYVRIHLAEASYLLTESLSSFYQKLDHPRFQRVHRSTVINTAYLQRVVKQANGGHQLILNGDVQLSLARSRKTLLPELLRLSQSQVKAGERA